MLLNSQPHNLFEAIGWVGRKGTLYHTFTLSLCACPTMCLYFLWTEFYSAAVWGWHTAVSTGTEQQNWSWVVSSFFGLVKQPAYLSLVLILFSLFPQESGISPPARKGVSHLQELEILFFFLCFLATIEFLACAIFISSWSENNMITCMILQVWRHQTDYVACCVCGIGHLGSPC